MSLHVLHNVLLQSHSMVQSICAAGSRSPNVCVLPTRPIEHCLHAHQNYCDSSTSNILVLVHAYSYITDYTGTSTYLSTSATCRMHMFFTHMLLLMLCIDFILVSSLHVAPLEMHKLEPAWCSHTSCSICNVLPTHMH